ncbi:T9SS type B sorting domain-containing protein [Niastella caeni]|uniref:T9SS type B sorting domain-containing protein n=1 Tax=Niastella caeni TaxID=2569763 RepID=A0A4S8HXA3_9BACT|nr:gliding motility-associated C-terminal domain-containing protein [Niastella caeni]THU39911.1 T9SS type B sorting domain-containing protein [Niastella caeni]
MRKILRGHVFNKHFLFTLCLGFSFFLKAHAQVSGTFTINSAVATGGSNFNSFTDAVASLSGGVNGAVIFNVQSGSGPYNEQVIINNITGASATNTILFNCNGVTLTFMSTNSTQRAGIKLNSADYVTFDNLVVVPQGVNFGEYGYGFHLLNDADNNTIRNCQINNGYNMFDFEANEGIVINGNNENSVLPGYSNCDDNLIQGNTISGGSVGITLSSIPVTGNPPIYINGNRILNNTISNFAFYGMQFSYNSGTQINGNDISGGPNLYISSGIYIGGLNQSLSVTNNRIHDLAVPDFMGGNDVTGILLNSQGVAGRESTIANNLIYNIQNNELQFGIAARNGLSSYFNIYHNTISLDDQILPGTETYGFYFENVTDIDVKNNIVTITRPSTNWNYGIYVLAAPPRFTSDHNDIYVQTGISFICDFGYYVGNDIPTIAQWRADTDLDHFSTDINPLYTNLAGSDFRPTAQPIDNMALFASITTDITSAARNTTNPDPGCYEFTSAACSTPVTAGTTFVAPDSIMCIGPKITLGVSGNSAGGGQTYTWQTSTTATGTFTNLTGALAFPLYEGSPTTTLYYRVAVTCGATTQYSNPIRVLVTSALNGGTYTINSALPTGGINFNSFSDAARALQCGVNGPIVFNVSSNNGPYNEQLIIPAVNTSATRTVTFNGNGATIAYEPTNDAQSAVIKLDGTDYITFDSLNVDVLGSLEGFGFGIQLMNNADHNTIRRCTVNVNKISTSPYYAGIVMNGDNINPKLEITNSFCDSNLIERNTVNGAYVGITCVSKSDVDGLTSYSVGNIIRKNTLIDNCNFGLYIAGTENLVVDSNEIKHVNRSIFTINPFQSIFIYRVNYGLSITRNRIHNLLEGNKTSVVSIDGIRFERVVTTAAKPHMVSNNALYYFRGNGIQQGLYAISSNYIKFYHNTVSLDDTASTALITTRGFALFGTGTTGIEVKNNNFVVRRGGTAPKYCIYLSTNDSGLVANNNNYYMNAASGTRNNVGYMGGIEYLSLTNWLATRKDSASISVDPVYHDMPNGDLTPTKIPFENRGTNVGITKDIWDATRSTTAPDIGAFEFTICRTLTNPVLTVDSAGVNVIRFSWQAIPNTSGYRVSRDGFNWTMPSSGAMGTTHTITGLSPRDTVGLMVKALGSRVDCPEYLSQRVTGQALTDQIFVPNTFTPNGNGQNDVFKVYSNVLSTVRWMVFNQWGEKVFETSDKQASWDGNYKGKPQPIGVYVYVVSGTLSDGTKVTQKGSFNLIR